jgi:hypothetical protein
MDSSHETVAAGFVERIKAHQISSLGTIRMDMELFAQQHSYKPRQSRASFTLGKSLEAVTRVSLTQQSLVMTRTVSLG